MTEKPHFEVVICTPGSGMTSGYVRSLLKTTYFLTANNISWNYMNDYSSHVSDARERTVGGTGFNNPECRAPGDGAWTYSKLFWIDSDIEWEPEDFMRLYKSDKQIISGCYMLENGEVTIYTAKMGPPMHANEILALKHPFQTVAVGFGFLCVARGVFERIERPWFSQEGVEIFNTETGEYEKKYPLIGEDLSWCLKVEKLGIQIWVDPLVRITHQRTIKMRWPEK